MKFSKVYVDRKYFAQKLGVKPSQIAVAQVSTNLDEVEITIAIDDNAVTKEEIKSVELSGGVENLRRVKLDN